MTETYLIIIISIISYLLGTIPSAFLLVRFTSGRDLRTIGTGNIGAMNSYEVTGRKIIGIMVFLMDALKGVSAVLLAKIFVSNTLLPVMFASFFVVLGHNFNIFIKLKGGRGLATAVGCYLLINPELIIFWGLMWLAGYYIIKKDVHVANVTATVFAPLMFYYTPEKITGFLNFVDNTSKTNLTLATIPVLLLVLLRHFKPILELIRKSLPSGENN
jgi:acyl phosphate:glycerol-3-phosphate acyltransferase